MYSFSNSIIISERVKDVFKFFQELKFLPIVWDYILVEDISNNREMKSGLEFNTSLLSDNKNLMAKLKILEITPNKAFSILNKKGGVEIAYNYTFKEIDRYTQIHCIVEADLENFNEELATEIFEVIKEEDFHHLDKIRDYFGRVKVSNL